MQTGPVLGLLPLSEHPKWRWQVELLKGIKQHLRILSLFGTGENAVKTQMLSRGTGLEGLHLEE